MTLQDKIKASIEAKKAQQAKQEDILANTDSYVNYLADKSMEIELVTKLDTIINQLNGMKAIITQDGTKYAVHCYPVAESIFGPIGARLMALATIAGAMFTTERQVEFRALTGIPYLIALDASHALGKPAYVTKAGVVVEKLPFQENYMTALIAVTHALGLDINYAYAIKPDHLTRWFNNAQAKVDIKSAEQALTASTDVSPFTLDDESFN